MKDEKFKRSLFKNNKITLDFFMYSPSALYQDKSSTYILNYNPILMMRSVNQNSMNETYQASDTYKITPKNIYRTVKFFNKVVSWFVDEAKKDLFLKDENDNLIFNADYNKLAASTGYYKYDSGVLQAIPTIVKLNDTFVEGVSLYINKTSNECQLTISEFATIFEILKNFSFSEEVMCNLAVYNYIINAGNVETNVARWNNRTYSKVPNTKSLSWD